MNSAEDPDAERLVSWADAVIAELGCGLPTDVCIRVVDEAESGSLNGRYRSQPKPTNVLSFPAEVSLPDAKQRILGDIVICDPVIKREASLQNKRVHDHYAHMIVHGMLHLYGYDHVDPVDADAMEDKEREILSGLGIADPYRVA